MYVPERVLRETSPEEDAEEKLMSPIYRRLDKTRSAHELFSYDTITGMFNRLPKFYDPETKIIGKFLLFTFFEREGRKRFPFKVMLCSIKAVLFACQENNYFLIQSNSEC